MTKSYTLLTEFFLFRLQFSYQYAALTLMTYVISIGSRFPYKMFIARETGNTRGSGATPAIESTNAYFHNNESVPFHCSPNIQP